VNGAPPPPRVDLEIERLTLHGPALSPARAARLRTLLEAELARLLARSTLDLPARSTPLAVTPPLRLPARSGDRELAVALARTIVHNLGSHR
jgi:hypothetical protein